MNETLDKRILLKGQMRICPKCDTSKELTENFQFHRANASFCRNCKECTNASRNEAARKRYNGYSKEEKERYGERQRVRRKAKKDGTYIDKRLRIGTPYTVEDRAKKLIRECRKNDKIKGRDNNMTMEYILSLLSEPCVYCGMRSEGPDRIDNSIGHMIGNCLPCCTICNMVRRDEFSYNEMLLLGQTIKEIKINRLMANTTAD